MNQSPKKCLCLELRYWLASALLLSPVLALYSAHFVHGLRTGQTATGFILDEMVCYVAYAREYSDSGQFHFSYGNPFDHQEDTPRIYFQPLTLTLAAVVALTGAESGLVEPGLVFVAFGLLAALVAIRLAIALFEDFFGLDTWPKKLVLVCFLWGGGVLALSGAATALADGQPVCENLTRFDPADGWWFLNFGRNLVLPTEALYHALVIGCILLLCRGRYAGALLLLAVLSVSHPFSGLQHVLVVVGWLLLERWFIEREAVPLWAIAAAVLIGAFHVGYYLIFLPSFQEHAVLMHQWTLYWALLLKHMAPAYALVALLAAWRCRRYPLAAEVMSQPRNRLLLVWLLVSFALANHEFAIAPHQPLHFTRGYIWTPLFLLGAPTLIGLLRWVGMRRTRWASVPLSAAVVLLMVLDNAAWFTEKSLRPTGIYLSSDEREVLRWLEAEAPPDALIVSDPSTIAYASSVYTRHRSWFAHRALTPHASDRKKDLQAFLETGNVPPEWQERAVLIISAKDGELRPLVDATDAADTTNDADATTDSLEEIFRNDSIVVLRRKPLRLRPDPP